MKTFLWTTLFWIVVVIAGLLCLGFGNLGTQVLDNGRLAKIMPKNVQTLACDPVVESTMETIDWCEKAKDMECNLVTTVETGDLQKIQDAIDSIVSTQKEMQSNMKDGFTALEEKMLGSSLTSMNLDQDTLEKQLIEKREQQKRELQSQIEALQAEMENL